MDLFTTLLAEYVHQDASLEMRLEKLLAEISAVGDGDLRVQAEVTPDLLGIVADSINYLICELAKVIIRVQKISAEEISSSKNMLSVVQEEIQMFENIAKVINTSDPITRENITTPLDYMYKSTKALKGDLERRLDLSNRLYASVSSFHLPAEETLFRENSN